jgi:hypothetical protein
LMTTLRNIATRFLKRLHFLACMHTCEFRMPSSTRTYRSTCSYQYTSAVNEEANKIEQDLIHN